MLRFGEFGHRENVLSGMKRAALGLAGFAMLACASVATTPVSCRREISSRILRSGSSLPAPRSVKRLETIFCISRRPPLIR